jgi:hypothetical protein
LTDKFGNICKLPEISIEKSPSGAHTILFHLFAGAKATDKQNIDFPAI